MKKFEIPPYYRSSITGKIKELRRLKDLRKQDFSPTLLDFGPVQFFIARHFGFCYGVENAIEISYRAIEENPDKRVYLLSQMIHNQEVNNDLQSRGIKFIMDTDGHQFIPWSELTPADVVIIPAFGTTVEIEHLLLDKGLEVQKYNTTCPFVEKVWNRSEKLSLENYTIIIHGKPKHEETRATFSHSAQRGASLVLRDMADAASLGDFLLGNK
ncbi:MAG TPA: 4-hydroxy-3-methylbut-2-enyl diphosphate reductase, partial [Chryseolinea sp.]|nr:4-hydroxy-3-methylbut-2-enyl diphosphate reductase [Chryseolinea sp.]